MAHYTVHSPYRRRRTSAVIASVIGRRLGDAILVLLAIAFLSYWGLTLSQNAVNSSPGEAMQSAVEAVRFTIVLIFHHPASYNVHREWTAPWRHVSTCLAPA
jgi:hypothetical protein